MMLLTFLLVGRFLDQNMRRRTRAVAANLAALKAETAVKFVTPEEIREVPVSTIQPGDLVLVRPGERISVDGVVIDGRSDIDQSLVTGETAPLAAVRGTNVYAGTVNLSGTLRLRVAAAAKGTLLDEVTRLLDNAVQARSRYVRLAERAAKLYAPLVHATALTTLHRLDGVRGELARCHHHRHRGPDHHLPVRARACDSGRAGGGVGRAVPRRRPAQCGRCDRAAGRTPTRSCSTRPAP